MTWVKNSKSQEQKIFRDFKISIGQAPKDLIKTIRFRSAIETLKNPKNIFSLTELAYNLGYADQSHFIKDFKPLAGIVPSKFISKTEEVNEKVESEGLFHEPQVVSNPNCNMFISS